MREKSKRTTKFATKTVVYCALMTALVTVATVTLGFRTGDFFFNCGDAVIFVTAALLGPLPAAVAGGLGSFFADLAVYPATMFFTLIIKGLEGLVCGLLMCLFRKISAGRVLSALCGAAGRRRAGGGFRRSRRGGPVRPRAYKIARQAGIYKALGATRARVCKNDLGRKRRCRPRQQSCRRLSNTTFGRIRNSRRDLTPKEKRTAVAVRLSLYLSIGGRLLG